MMRGTAGVLFDLDGTLFTENIFLPQAAALTESITEVYGINAGIGPDNVPSEVQVDWTGQTDLGIAFGICERAGLTHDEVVDKVDVFMEEYEARFLSRCPTSLRGSVTPGMEAVLEELQGRGWDLRVVTGNLRVIAYMKLRRAGLADYFDLKPSGTGNDGRARADIVRFAKRKLRVAVVVGDTWRDITAAHEAKCSCVALKTPRHSLDSLKNAENIARTVDDLIPMLETIVYGELRTA